MNNPILTQLNNGILVDGMPMKDLTSDNDSSFAMSRKLFMRAFTPNTNFAIEQQGTTVIQRQALGIDNKVVIDGKKTVGQKKWIGGNRDASSMLTRRKITNIGQIDSTPGPQSFKNIVDNNTAKDAINRARSSGYRVPLKVTQQHLLPIPSDSNSYFRIVASGLIAGTSYVTATGSAYGVSPGVYSYTRRNLTGTPIANAVLGTMGRSYNVVTITRATGETTVYPIYDVFGSVNNANSLATLLNSFDNTVIVIVYTFDEPKSNVNAALITAMKRCGASSTFPTFIQYRSAYILVGIPDVGEGNGLEKYRGDIIGTGDPNAWLDLRISLSNGDYTYISG